MVWHAEAELPSGLDLIVLPGGFSYGDYLRCGAMAAQSPVMSAVRAEAERGRGGAGRVQRVPGAVRGGDAAGRAAAERALKYVCKPVSLEIANGQTRWTAGFGERRTAQMTVGNGEGNYFADDETLDRLEGEGGWCSATPTTRTARCGHRGDRQRERQRAGADAPPRPGVRAGAGQRGRGGALPERAGQRVSDTFDVVVAGAGWRAPRWRSRCAGGLSVALVDPQPFEAQVDPGSTGGRRRCRSRPSGLAGAGRRGAADAGAADRRHGGDRGAAGAPAPRTDAGVDRVRRRGAGRPGRRRAARVDGGEPRGALGARARRSPTPASRLLAPSTVVAAEADAAV
jgi:hypothetical protein